LCAAREHNEETGGGAQVKSDLDAEIRPAPARPEAIVLLRLVLIVPHHPASSAEQIWVLNHFALGGNARSRATSFEGEIKAGTPRDHLRLAWPRHQMYLFEDKQATGSIVV